MSFLLRKNGTPSLTIWPVLIVRALQADSTVTLHLTIYHSVTSTRSVTLCENDLPYHYVNGDIDTTFEVGTPQLSTFNFQLLTQHGCDSVVTLLLTVYQPETELVELTICESDLPYHYVNGDIDTTFEIGTPQPFSFQFSIFNFPRLRQHCDVDPHHRPLRHQRN